MTDPIGTMPGAVTLPAAPPEPAGPGAAREEHAASLWSDAWRELRRKPVAILSTLFVVVFSSMAAFPRLWTSIADPNSTCDLKLSNKGPSTDHIFGNSELGCDYYAMTIHGARASILTGIIVTAMVTVFGGFLGILAGYYRGFTDTFLSRLADVFLGLPLILGAVVFLTLLRSQSIWGVIGALAILIWPLLMRIMRSSVMSVRDMDFVHAARSLGASDTRIIMRHILPNAVAPTIVVATIVLGVVIVAEATLSFLGVGLQPPGISWGLMISRGQVWVLDGHPHLLLFPGLFLVATVLSFLLLADAVRDALDPKLR